MENANAITPDFELTQATILKLRVEYDRLQGSHESLLSFIADPDAYMAGRLGDLKITDSVHFHVQHGDIFVPADPAPPDHQLVFTSEIKVSSDLISTVTDVLRKKQLEDVAKGGGVYCRGCRICAIARIK
jgi:hypothetical protein